MQVLPPGSARALVVTSIIAMAGGFLVMSPSAAFLAHCVAALLAAPALAAAGRLRVIAAVLLLCAIALAASKYPDLSDEQRRYREQVRGGTRR